MIDGIYFYDIRTCINCSLKIIDMVNLSAALYSDMLLELIWKVSKH